MVTFVGGTAGRTSGTSFNLTWPSVNADDQALLFWTGQTGFSFTDPTGFTLVESFVASSGSQTVRLYRKTCTGSEDGSSISLVMGSANKHSAGLVVYRGVSTTAPINQQDQRDETVAGTTHACPAQTPTVAGCVPVVAISERFSSGTTNYVPPAGYTERADSGTEGGGGATTLAIADDGLATAHAAGVSISPGSWSNGVSNSNVVTWTVLLAPAAQTVAVGQATETDTANAITWSPKHRLVGQALETDLAVGLVKRVAVAQATETEQALTITPDLRPVVEWSIKIDWDGDGFDTSDDLTDRILGRSGISIEYGRDQARSLSPMAAGRAGLELDNTTKDYSPDNQDSPLYGKPVQARPIEVRATLDAEHDYVLFRGFTDEYTLNPSREQRSVSLTALDAVGLLQGAKATTELYSGVRTGTAIGYVLDAIGWPADARDLDAGATIVRWWWAEDQDAFEAIQQLVQSEGPGAIVFVDVDGNIVFRDRHHRLFETASLTAQTTFLDDSADGEPAFSDFSYEHGWRDVVNSISVKVDEIDPSPETTTVWENQSLVNIGADETLTLHITLDNPCIRPTSSYTIIAGTVSDSITVDSGQTLTWSLTAGSGGVTLADLAILGQELTTSRSYTILVEDQDSINNYGKRSLEYSLPWAGYNDAQAVASLILDASAERRPIVTITLRSSTWFETDRLVQQLDRNLSDRVHVREPQSCVDHDFFVEQIKHTASEAGLVIETQIGMERAIEQADNVFRFNDDDHGFNDGVFASVGLQDPKKLFRFNVTGQGFDDGAFAT